MGPKGADGLGAWVRRAHGHHSANKAIQDNSSIIPRDVYVYLVICIHEASQHNAPPHPIPGYPCQRELCDNCFDTFRTAISKLRTKSFPDSASPGQGALASKKLPHLRQSGATTASDFT